MTTLHFLRVIIELLSYLKRDRGTVRGRDIEREACVWSDKGLLTAADAQRYLATIDAEQPLRNAFYQIFGIVGRKPTAAGIDHHCTLYGKGFPPDTVKLALARMKRQIGSFSASYLRKMLTAWDQSGVHTVSEVTALEPEISEEKRARAVTRPPFGAVTASASAQNTRKCAARRLGKEMSEVKRRRTQQSED